MRIMAANELHPVWVAAFNNQSRPGEIRLTSSHGVAGLAVPLTAADLSALAEHKPLGGAIASMAPKLATEIGANASDAVKLLHPEWHSTADPAIQGLAVFANSMELWQAFQDHNQTKQLLTGAQLGANVVDLVLNATESAASAAGHPAIHGCCLFIRAAAGIAKVCVEVREDEKQKPGIRV